jgi:hypothetical protein
MNIISNKTYLQSIRLLTVPMTILVAPASDSEEVVIGFQATLYSQ